MTGGWMANGRRLASTSIAEKTHANRGYQHKYMTVDAQRKLTCSQLHCLHLSCLQLVSKLCSDYNIRITKSCTMALCIVPAWFWYTSFFYRYSSTITAPFPSPFVALSTNPPYFTYNFLSSPTFLPPSLPNPPIYAYNMPALLLYRPVKVKRKVLNLLTMRLPVLDITYYTNKIMAVTYKLFTPIQKLLFLNRTALITDHFWSKYYHWSCWKLTARTYQSCNVTIRNDGYK